ncbi:MAG TPA: hypothetical protein VL947_04190, partial [Cytophagales bacterium]|nr:hypothetical protein [Cytophagales bacterium]
MSKISYSTCEPFRAWNRLEPRSRKEDFDKNLQVGVHDALWFLTRQWQFGEFQGEDTGSAIFAKLHIQTSQLSHYKGGRDETVTPYSDHSPMEETVEQTHAPLNDKTKVMSGKHFRKILQKHASTLADFDPAQYRQKLKSLYPYQQLTEVLNTDSADVVVAKTKLLSNQALVQYNDFFSEVDFDGYALFMAASASMANTRDQIALNVTHHIAIEGALTEYTALFLALYAEELKQVKGAWNPSQLEYQFKCLLPEESNAKTILTADEYYTGSLDWYSLDLDLRSSSAAEFSSTVPSPLLLQDQIISVIPTEARFAGMPNSRWWQFENGAVDLNNFKADTTDLANLIFSEYAFMFSNDWMIIPIP